MRTAQNLLLSLLSTLTACQSQLTELKKMGGPSGTATGATDAATSATGEPTATATTGGTGTASDAGSDASIAPSQSATLSDGGDPLQPPDAGTEPPDGEAGLESDAGDAAIEPDATGVGTSASTAGSMEPSASVASSTSAIPSASALDSGAPSMCPEGATYSASDDACYLITPTPLTRVNAGIACMNVGTGWHLVEVMSAQQNAYIRSLSAAGELWLAATRSDGGTTWRWPNSGIIFFNGLDVTGTPVPGVYVNWNPVDQPSGGTEELCARMLTDGTWGDLDCPVTSDLPYGACQGPTQ